MTLAHHPSDETLARYAGGVLPAGPALVVATHLASCPRCRAELRRFEAVGGALLDAMEPTPLAADALARALAALDAPSPAETIRVPPSAAPAGLEGIVLPEPLASCEFGRWRWLGPGVRASRVRLPGQPDPGVMLLRVGAGRALPDHGHTGTEWTQVLHGSFSDSLGRYGPGDLSEVDEDVEHQPLVDPDGECLCLAALEGTMRLRGWIGRLVQPFVRF